MAGAGEAGKEKRTERKPCCTEQERLKEEVGGDR